jgi:threonine/homoserine/homoserine lactone efflux protein
MPHANFEIWTGYAAIALLFAFMPGPAVLFVIGQGVWRGPGAAMRATAAINLVNVTYIALSGLGLAALLSLSPVAFTIIKLVGAAYLLFLGVQAIRSSFRPHAESLSAKPGRAFIDGLIVQGSNPKVFLFLTAILPAFLVKTQPLAPQLAVLALIGVVTETLGLTFYGLLAGYIRRRANLPAIRTWLERIGGVLLIVVAVIAALTGRS